MSDRNISKIEMNESRQKLIRKLSGTHQNGMRWWRSCSKDKKICYSELEDTASNNETKYQPVRMTPLLENQDVPGTIHPGGVKTNSAQVHMFLPHMNNCRRKLEV